MSVLQIRLDKALERTLTQLARKEYRTPAAQALYLLHQMLREVPPDTATCERPENA